MWTHYLDRRELCELRIGGKMRIEFLNAGPEGICCIFDEHSLFSHLMENSRNGEYQLNPIKLQKSPMYSNL